MRAVTEKKEVRCLGDLGVISPVPQTLLGDPSGQLQLLLCLGRMATSWAIDRSRQSISLISRTRGAAVYFARLVRPYQK